MENNNNNQFPLAARKKAKELIDKFVVWSEFMHEETARQCALIALDEMIEIQKDYYGLVFTSEFRERINKKVEFLEEVKKQIEIMSFAYLAENKIN